MGYFDFPDLVQALLQAGEPVEAYRYDGLWFDIGRRDDYEQAVAAWVERSRLSGNGDAAALDARQSRAALVRDDSSQRTAVAGPAPHSDDAEQSWAVPLSDIAVDEEIVAAVEEVVRSGWWSMGPRVAEFEREFADVLRREARGRGRRTGRPRSISRCSRSAAARATRCSFPR